MFFNLIREPQPLATCLDVWRACYVMDVSISSENRDPWRPGIVVCISWQYGSCFNLIREPQPLATDYTHPEIGRVKLFQSHPRPATPGDRAMCAA